MEFTKKHHKTWKIFGVLLISFLSSTAWAQDFEAGNTYYEQGNYAVALREFEPLAQQGHARAQQKLSRMYLDGHAVPQDNAKALHWFRLSADQGDAMGQRSVAYMYREGLGVQQDDAEAVKWFRLAAEQGEAIAQNNLGAMYGVFGAIIRKR